MIRPVPVLSNFSVTLSVKKILLSNYENYQNVNPRSIISVGLEDLIMYRARFDLKNLKYSWFDKIIDNQNNAYKLSIKNWFIQDLKSFA